MTQAHLTLADGRQLAYLQIGPADGAPVISCHGGLSSRLDIAPAAATADELGVRIVSPDRPGVGGSWRQPGRSVLDWPADVAELADHLGLERFALLGWSVGGMYAQACAVRLAARVRALALVASVIPRAWSGMTEEINRMDRVFMRLSGAASPIERTIFTVVRGSARHVPAAFAARSGAPDDVGIQLSAAVAEGLADTGGVVEEYRLLGADWGFDPASISVPTRIWQGDDDDLIPAAWGERLAASIPGATLRLVPDASHFLWYDHWAEILGWLSGPAV